MLGFIGRHWRGEAGFWLSLLGFTLLLTGGTIFTSVEGQARYGLEAHPNSRIVPCVVLGALVLSLGIWQLIGTWRASSAVKAPGRWLVTRWLARVLALAVAALALFIVSTVPRALSEYVTVASDADDIGRLGYSLRAEGDRLILDGAVTWGFHDAFEKALAANPGIRTLVLDSNGGHVSVAWRLVHLIRARGLDTMVTRGCASACTMMFAAGKRRILKGNAKLGFHSASLAIKSNQSGDQAIALSERHIAAFWRVFGAPQAFIDRIFATPASDVWVPTIAELREAHIVTDVVK